MREKIKEILQKLLESYDSWDRTSLESWKKSEEQAKDLAVSAIIKVVEEEMLKERTEFKDTLNEIRRINAETLTRLGRIAELKSKLKEEK